MAFSYNQCTLSITVHYSTFLFIQCETLSQLEEDVGGIYASADRCEHLVFGSTQGATFFQNRPNILRDFLCTKQSSK